MPGHILRRQGDSAGILAAAADLAGIDGAVLGDLLDDPLLPVRDTERGVIPAGLDQVTGSDGQVVAAGRRHRVIDRTGRYASGADALIQLGGLIVRRHRDRLTVTGMLCDVRAGVLVVTVQGDQAHYGELVEHLASGFAVTHRQREGCVFGVGEAVEFGHVVGAAPNLRGHVEHPAPADGGELGAVADERDRRPRLCGHSKEGVSGVLVEHPRFVHDHPLTTAQHRFSRRAGVDAP